jgi:hypothetical protein
MAKSDLLKQAIADANAVKETALANAKIALQEAFAPRLERMLATKMSEELEDEDELGADVPTDMGDDVDATGGEELNGTDVGDLSIDVDNDGEFDEFDVMSKEPIEEPAAGIAPEDEMSDEEMATEYNEGYDDMDEDLELESIIRELEGDLPAEPMAAEMDVEEEEEIEDLPEGYGHEEELEEDIDAIIEAILREEDYEADGDVSAKDADGTAKTGKELAETKSELEEAYKTVKKLTSIINEVNLLNAKLLYTNKLFRNFELSEGQKMKVIENFDRAGNTREVKLVFSTLAESFKRPETKKRVVKESYASKATQTTAPKSAPILNEGFELADRWKKLAGLL